MKGTVSMAGVTEQMGNISPLPGKGIYEVDIVLVKERMTEKNDPMPSIKLQIISGKFKDCWVWDNILTPQPESEAAKILGRTKHFLHCLGEEFEGDEISWNTDNWIGKRIKIRIDHEDPNQYHKFTKAIIAEYILEEPGEFKTLGDDDSIPF